MFFHSFIAMEYAFTLFFTVNCSVNAARSSPLNGVCPRKFRGKGIKFKTFPQKHPISLCGVVVRYKRVEPMVPGSTPIQNLILFPSFFLFFPFSVLLFSINIYLNNCYLTESN